ncbi:MAG: ATP-dependent RecD-like DNA helicase [Oscillospiraceae bacterium]
MNQKSRETIEGIIEDILYRSEETGFTVLEISYNNELLTVVGEFADICVGEEIKATGYFTTHPTYGNQFKADFVERQLPTNSASIFKYLSSGVIKGIGPGLSKRIVEKFGDETINIIENYPEKLLEVKGFSPKKCDDISAEFKRLFGIRSVMLFLSNYGIMGRNAVSVWKKWGTTAPTIINKNPYVLCSDDIGMDFSNADEIANSVMIAPDDPFRIEGAIIYVLRANAQNGHCCVPIEKLVDKASLLLQIDNAMIENAISDMLSKHSLENFVKKHNYIYLPDLYEAETYIAGRLKMMLMLSYDFEGDNDEKINKLEEKLEIKYADLQRDAISCAISKGIMILTGGPGTGKTTTLNGIISLLENEGYNVALAAPTGRAAKRMSIVTGHDAKTIHRLLEVDFKDENGYNKFKRNVKNPLPNDAIIIDEMSMVDVKLFESLLKALKVGSKLILVGDSDQLPPVGAGNILKDLCDSEIISRVHLTEIFRQAAKSLIVTNAHKIVSGLPPDITKKDSDFFFLPEPSQERASQVVCDLVNRRLPKTYGYSPIWDIQVLSPSRQGILGTNQLNLALQAYLNPPDKQKGEHKTPFTIFREGDKVMQNRNNYDIIWQKDGEDGMGIFNGDIGIIEMIDKASKTILVNFDEKIAPYTFEMTDELELAYAITIHKSQGNEFDAVIIPLMGSHSKLHYRNLLYTGVTRAKKLLILIGSNQTIIQMVNNDRKTLRYTNLTAFLKDGLSDETTTSNQ